MSQLIFAKIPKVMKAIKPIGKDQENKFQKYAFRGIDDMYNGIHPALVEHGVFCVPQVIASQTQELEGKEGKTSFRVVLRVSHKFYAEDGSFVDVITEGEGIDTSDKATNKAMSAAMKYAFIELFSIPTEDIADGDKDSPDAGKTRLPAGNAPTIKTVTTVGGFGL